MFKKTKRTVKSILIVLLSLGLVYVCYIQDRHIRRYNLFVKEQTEKAPKIEQQQIRYLCSKDLYKTEGHIRHHYHITAPYSTLLLSPKDKGFELIEHLKELCCRIEDNPETHEYKEIRAKEGSYFYGKQKLVALDVSLIIEQEGDNKLTGHASTAQIELSKDSPLFFAEDFIAHIESK